MNKMVNYYQPQAKASRFGRRLNLRVLNRCLFLAAFALGFLYLLTVSDLTVKGFALQELKAKSSQLSREKTAYEEQANALQSYYYLNAKAENLNMVAVGDIDYLTLSNTAVAKR